MRMCESACMCVCHGTCGNVIRKCDLHMLGAPRYSPHKVQMAYVGQPFYFDFNYTAKSPPSSCSWYKNGRPFKPDGKRVTVDHTSIIFTTVLHGDAGQYSVRAYTHGRSARATSTLRGINR